MTKLLTAAFVILALAGSPLFAEHGTLFGAELKHALDFPHFGNGDFTRSELVLVNLGSASHPSIHFYSRSGEIIDASTVVEVTPALVLMMDGGLTTHDPIPSLGELTIPTNGMGLTVAGSLSVLSPSLMNGFLRYYPVWKRRGRRGGSALKRRRSQLHRSRPARKRGNQHWAGGPQSR